MSYGYFTDQVLMESSASACTEADFRTLFQDVKPLKDNNRYYPPRRPAAVPTKKRDPLQAHSTLRRSEHLEYQHEFTNGEMSASHQVFHQFTRAHLSKNTLRKLRNGYWNCQHTLDLHGLNRSQALDVLNSLFFQLGDHSQCIRIIHGKGYHSSNEPVLKYLVRNWLKNHPRVLAYCDANASFGGSGAVVVLLKHKRLMASRLL